MRRARWLASLLWTSAACGRIGLDALAVTPGDASQADVAGAADLQVPASMSFDAACGQAMPPTVDLTIVNTGATSATVTDAAISAGFTVVTSLPLEIPANGSGALTVRPPAAVVGTDIPGSEKSGTLTVTAGDSTYEVALSATTIGSTVGITALFGGPLTLTFAAGSGLCPVPISALLVNTGNTIAEIVFQAPSVFALSGFSGGALDAGGSAVVDVRVVTATACSGAGMVGYTVTADSCDVEPTVVNGTFQITGSTSCFCS